MSDIATIVRAYYDTAAEPVTAAEILHPETVPQPSAKPSTPRLPNWAVAVAVAVALVIIIGGASLLLGGSDQSDEPVSPTNPTPVTTTLEGTDTAQPPRASIWMTEVLLTVDPPTLPPVPGTYDVTVQGFHNGEPRGVWVTACPQARAIVDPAAWPTQDSGIASFCGVEEAQIGTGEFANGTFTTTLQVEVDQSAIQDGGIIITTGHIFIPVTGNVLVRITNEPETPWEQAYDGLDLTHLTGLITYWPPFVDNFNTAYAELESCDEAYALATAALSTYQEALTQWDDTQRPTPGYVYDQAVAQLTASERWLHDHTCPGRYDFTTIG